MGYRLNIDEHKYYGTKLYGYVNEKQLKSYKYLEKNKIIDGDECWFDGTENRIFLQPDEFKKFIKLYNQDINKEYADKRNKDWFINEKEIQELLESENPKIIYWD